VESSPCGATTHLPTRNYAIFELENQKFFSSKVLTNNQKTLTQASLTRAKDDFVKGTKKAATLAYPEDALITHHAAAKVSES